MIGLVMFLLSGVVAPEQCEECTEKAVCGPHKDSDAELLKSLKDKLRSKEDGERLAAYQAVGEAQRAHANGPSKTLGKALAKGVEDDAIDVRTACVKALAEVGEPDLAVKALVEAMEDLTGFLTAQGLGGRGGRGAQGGGGAAEDEAEEKVAAARAYAQALVTGLSQLPDDRSVKVLADTLNRLGRRMERELVTPLAQALLDLGARDGIEAVIGKFLAQTRAGASEGGRGGGRGGDGGRGLHAMLLRLAVDRGIEGTPEWSDEEPADWETWFRRNRKAFPAKLGKVTLESRKASSE